VRNGPVRFELGAGGGLDVFVVAPVSSALGVELSSHRQNVSPVVSLLMAGTLATSATSRFVLAGMLDYDLQPHRYVVAQGAQTTVLLEPWKLRPTVSLGIVFKMAGRQP